MSEELRKYQTDGLNKIFEKWKAGKRSVLFQMPTGTGKTVLFSEIVRRGFNKKRKILIVAHRKELVEQIKNKLISKNIEAGIIMAGEKPDYSKIVQIASIQTLSRRKHPEANLIIIDECQNLTPYQVKAIITRAGEGSKVVGLGNLSQIDTPYLNATSSGLTYMTERFKGFTHGGSVHLSGVPRSILAEYAESHL